MIFSYSLAALRTRSLSFTLILSSVLIGAIAQPVFVLAQTQSSVPGVVVGSQVTGQGQLNVPPAQATIQTAPGVSGSSLAADAMLYPSEDFRLGAGDLINVRIFLVADYSATVRVDESGNVLLPLVGTVRVGGLSVRDAQSLIAQRLREGQFYRQPQVIIQVAQTVNGTALITGEMHAEVPVTVQRTLRDVLLTAGGLPATASHTIKIVRSGQKEPIVVNLGTDLASSSTADIPVLPHDIIQITRASVVYVLGAFRTQGAVPLDQAAPLTLLQCAALSGGINFEGNYRDLRIVRTFGDERRFVNVDIKKVRAGIAPDPVLQANDIVYLPTNAMKAAGKSLGVGGILGLLSLVNTFRNY